MTHTPGPWLLDGHTVHTIDKHSECNRWWASVQATYRGPANEYPQDITKAELTANARLIAAAPELYDALGDLMVLLEDRAANSPTLSAAMQNAAAAMKRAEGR